MKISKTKILLALSLVLLQLFFYFSLAHSQFYKSENFEQVGTTEYIGAYWGTHFTYWTNKNPTSITLVVKNLKRTNIWSPALVSFPNNKQNYKLSFSPQKLLCEHPDGRKQWFTALPTVFESRNFEREGVIEYIQCLENGQYVYFTNQNTNFKINLQIISKKNTYPIQVKFPNDVKVYTFDWEPVCFGSLICTHPDGKKQTFTYYHWNKELK